MSASLVGSEMCIRDRFGAFEGFQPVTERAQQLRCNFGAARLWPCGRGGAALLPGPMSGPGP
eukprot:5835723-Alexandrium_andersonii.AAC.1